MAETQISEQQKDPKTKDAKPEDILTFWQRTYRFFRHQIIPLAVLILALTSVRSAVADWNDVPTGSMKPTILEGDRIFVNKLAYDLKIPFTTTRLAKWADPQRGDVVIFFSPHDGTRLVKRVIGIPGDIVEMHDNRLIVQGQLVSYLPLDQETIDAIGQGEQPEHEFYTESISGADHPVMFTPRTPSKRNFGPLVIPEGKYLMMGDNRDNSNDSRYYGLVDRDLIVGEALAVVISLDPDRHYKPRWSRFFSSLR